MKVTAITAQQKNPDRVNVMIDGKYRFSLDIFQVADLGVKVGASYTEEELDELEKESEYGKVYARALEYCMMRPRSSKEVREYLYKKTRDQRTRTGEMKQGIPMDVTERVFKRLQEKGYIDDMNFARYWVENRNLRKGISVRKLQAELLQKGISRPIIAQVLNESSRSQSDELQKVIDKKRSRYPDEQKFIQYLRRQGFMYDDIRAALADDDQ